MKIDKYSYSGTSGKPKNPGVGIGAGYIIILIVFFIVFIAMAFLLFGMRKGLKEAEEQEVVQEEVSEPVYKDYEEVLMDIFSNKCGYSYSITFEKAKGNAYFMDDCILKTLTDGCEYTINGNILEKGISGTVSVQKSDCSIEYDYGFTENKSLLDMDITEYLSTTGEYEDIYSIGNVSSMDLKESISGMKALDAISSVLKETDAGFEVGTEGEVFIKIPQIESETGYRFIDRALNDYPGTLELEVYAEQNEEQKIIYIDGTGDVNFRMTLEEIRSLNTNDGIIQKCCSYSEKGVFESDTPVMLNDFDEVMSRFK